MLISKKGNRKNRIRTKKGRNMRNRKDKKNRKHQKKTNKKAYRGGGIVYGINMIEKLKSFEIAQMEKKPIDMGRFKYINFLSPPEYECVIWDMNSKGNQDIWNSMMDLYIKNGPELFGDVGKVQGISRGGVNYAKIDDDRTNPAVAIALRKDYVSDNIEHFIGKVQTNDGDSDFWHHHVFGFIPFSRIMDEKEKDKVRLLVPLGLQKTPAGYGWYNKVTIDDIIRVGDAHTLRVRTNGIKNFFESLMEVVKENHQYAGILTRFYTPRSTKKFRGVNYVESYFAVNHMMAKWSKMFPKHMRVGFRNISNYGENNKARIKSMENIKDYDPGKGGIDYNDKQLSFYNYDGDLLFKLNDILKYPALENYLMSKHTRYYKNNKGELRETEWKVTTKSDLCDFFGCLITTWPDK